MPDTGTVPLIYPTHLDAGRVRWPKQETKKPNALLHIEAAQKLLVPNENYVLVKRFSAKEEKRRVVAAVYFASNIVATHVGFENHLNYFHAHGHGLPLVIAKGLAAFLNSTLVDAYFRQFNGHTQVNATDLRNIRYPTMQQLEALGTLIPDDFPDQEELDKLIERVLPAMSDEQDPIRVKRRIEEATAVLNVLGFPRSQQNERSALTLLALLRLEPDTPWQQASDPLCGITPMMNFFAQYYGKTYKPNTRETVRRQTIHQFLDAGLVVENPDDPTRPTTSPRSVYQIERGALELLRTYKEQDWERNLQAYLSSVETLKQRYAQEREMRRIPVQIAQDKTILLSPGGQNILVEQILNEFASRFTPGAKALYVGDTDNKFAYIDEEGLATVGITIEPHGKIPDVILHHVQEDWLVLVEAVTSHGPIDAKRMSELKQLFRDATVGLVFVTAFLDKKTMGQYLSDLSWETDVWIAESPSHLIHFDGERFLGPY